MIAEGGKEGGRDGGTYFGEHLILVAHVTTPFSATQGEAMQDYSHREVVVVVQCQNTDSKPKTLAVQLCSQALPSFPSLLQATKSWAEPGNEVPTASQKLWLKSSIASFFPPLLSFFLYLPPNIQFGIWKREGRQEGFMPGRVLEYHSQTWHIVGSPCEKNLYKCPMNTIPPPLPSPPPTFIKFQYKAFL